ncbi:MAG: hypothetical protein IT366_22110 [Candidatus Hydrogenedentes bacterium]|nr:hypothetical protein [Candidatus Hydrogenedentota bacterium]
MGSVVYILCALTSAACAVLLTRGFLRTRERLLLWSSLCFILLAISNVLLVIDLALLPRTIDLSVIRTVPAFLGVCVLLFGLIWESR